MNFLVVDDDEVIRDSLCGFIEMKGHTCKQASSGEEAIDIIIDECVDVVVTDLKMPDMDGIDLLKNLRKLCPQTKVIIMTGHADTETAMEAVNFGAVGFFRKSIDNLKLARMIHAIETETMFDDPMDGRLP